MIEKILQTPDRFPEADDVKVANYNEGFGMFDINANTFIVIATRGHRQDDSATKLH